jgi:hypothetical protein
MVPEKYRLAAIGRFLLESFERRRPGLRDWTPEIEASLRREADAQIHQMERQLSEMGIEDPEYWARARAALQDILVPRYAALVQDELALQKRDYGIWRGGDLVARGVFAVVAFLLGVLAVELPYIPIYAKWFPALLLIAGPLLPDAILWWYRQRYQRKLQALVEDLARASESLDAYRPFSELQRSFELRGEAPPDEARAPGATAESNGGDPSGPPRKVRS